jgi:hypothetical protein
MVLANRGKPRYTFHISSGKRSTPADRGHFRFYSRQPGYNSLGMLDSVYYNGGEAIHGLPLRADLSSLAWMHPQPDPRCQLHIQLGPARDEHLRLLVHGVADGTYRRRSATPG